MLTTRRPPTEYFFESLEFLKPELPSQYDWHVQPDCQRPSAFRLSGALQSSFTGSSTRDFPAVLETFQTYQLCRARSTHAAGRSIGIHLTYSFGERCLSDTR